MNNARARCAVVTTLLILASCSGAAAHPRADIREQQKAVRDRGHSTTAEPPPKPVDTSGVAATTTVDPRQAFLNRLLSVSRQMNASLTPAAVAEIFSAPVRATEASDWLELDTNGTGLSVQMQASGPNAFVRWIEFSGTRELGVTLADLESLYGTRYHALPPAKDGTTVIFDTTESPVARDAYVSAQLWSPRVERGTKVSQLQLRYPR